MTALIAPATAQSGLGYGDQKVTFKAYHRVEGEQVQVAIRVSLERKWHIFHTELGGPGALAKPTEITFESEGIELIGLQFPEPHRVDQAASNSWVWQHEGRFVVYALGELDDADAAEDLALHITGQVCEEGDYGQCIPVDETVSSKLGGPDALFADFPEIGAESTGAATETELLFEERPEQQDTDEVKLELFVREDGDRVRAAVVFDIQEHWHIGHSFLRDDEEEASMQPTRLQLVGEGVEWGAPTLPEPYKYTDKYDSPWFFAHEGRVVALFEGAKTGELGDIELFYAGQVCDEMCIGFNGVLQSSGSGADADFVAAASTETDGHAVGASSEGASTGSDDSDDDGSGDGATMLQFILLAIGGGLFALVMPCTYPMIPITISFFTKQADARGGKVLPLSLLYGAGIVAIFVGIGVIVGPLIMVFATHWMTNLVIGVAFLFFSLVLFGAINLQPPAFLMQAAGKASMKGGYLGVFLMGATLVITSFTCTAPFVGTLLAAGATVGGESDLWRVALGMGVFGLTMAIPFTILSLVPGRVAAMPQGGEWMNTIKVTLGFVEIAAALKFISNADLVLGWGVLSRELFLLLWAAIFVLCALYLFGKIPIKGHKVEELGPARAIFAMSFMLFGLYCWHGYTGHRMDNIMTALAPAYSSRIGGPGAGESGGGNGNHGSSWTMIVDDYDAARQEAIAQNKPLFLNFTGHT